MTNVVSLKKSPDPKENRSRGNSDKRLIEECVIYVQSIAAFEAGFSADPDGDNVSAEKYGYPHLHRGHAAIEKIAKTPARTADGLQAKASVVPIVLEDSHGTLDEHEEAFFLSFAEEVKAFLESAARERHED